MAKMIKLEENPNYFLQEQASAEPEINQGQS